MIEHVVRALSGEVDEVLLLGGGPVPPALAGLSEREPMPMDVGGPMAGILGAMRARARRVLGGGTLRFAVAGQPSAVHVACSRRDDPERGPSCHRSRAFVEPLFALYEPEARVLLEEAAAAGEYALHRLASSSRVANRPNRPPHLRRCWFNANTPHELASLRAG